jgi:hypothetical protein
LQNYVPTPNQKIPIRAKNCKPNPYCIYRLGLEKFEKLQQSQNSGNAAEAMVRRNPEIQPCGLVNYGNFCYVNSFLQVLTCSINFARPDARKSLGDVFLNPYFCVKKLGFEIFIMGLKPRKES